MSAANWNNSSARRQLQPATTRDHLSGVSNVLDPPS
jgi:hypothetical protein